MARLLHKICAWLLAGLGAVHTALTPCFTGGELSPDAVWFAGAGVAMVFGALLNLLFNRVAGAADSGARLICYVANVVFLVFAVLAVTVVPEPQAFLGLALIAVVTCTAFLLRGGGEGASRSGG